MGPQTAGRQPTIVEVRPTHVKHGRPRRITQEIHDPGRSRVLILVKGLGLGGVERLLSRSVPALDRGRFEYEICYFTPWKDDVVSSFSSQGVRVHCLDVSNELSLVAFWRLARLIGKGSYDLIHTHSPYPSVLARFISLFHRQLRIVHTEHSLPDSRNFLTRLANHLTYPICDLVIAISADVERAIVAKKWLRPPATQVIRGGVASAGLVRANAQSRASVRTALGIPDDHKVIGNVAHLRKQKGHTLLLEVAGLVVKQKPKTTFVLVGREKEPGFEAELRSMARRLGIEGSVVFAGFVPDPYPILSTLDLFLLTSQYEGFPIALIEAMALGVASVATDVGGVSEALRDGTDGLLAPFGDVETLTAQVLRLLSNDAERARLAASAQRRVHDEFSIEEMIHQVEATYTALLMTESP